MIFLKDKFHIMKELSSNKIDIGSFTKFEIGKSTFEKAASSSSARRRKRKLHGSTLSH